MTEYKCTYNIYHIIVYIVIVKQKYIITHHLSMEWTVEWAVEWTVEFL